MTVTYDIQEGQLVRLFHGRPDKAWEIEALIKGDAGMEVGEDTLAYAIAFGRGMAQGIHDSGVGIKGVDVWFGTSKYDINVYGDNWGEMPDNTLRVAVYLAPIGLNALSVEDIKSDGTVTKGESK